MLRTCQQLFNTYIYCKFNTLKYSGIQDNSIMLFKIKREEWLIIVYVQHTQFIHSYNYKSSITQFYLCSCQYQTFWEQ